MSYPRYPAYKASGVAWLGEIPAHWEFETAKRLFVQTRTPAAESDEQLAATQKYGVIPQAKFIELEEQKVVLALSGTDNFKHVEKDDFVISLRSFQGGIERSFHAGCVSPAYTVMRPSDVVVPGYFAYVLKCAPFIAKLQSVTDGIREGKTIRYEQFGSVTLPLPKSVEQQAIAAFLDHKTGELDALIAEKQRLLALLQEQRAALITQAVTKGLDPSAPRKPSGVAWLGEIPAHWEVKRLKFLVAETLKYGANEVADIVDPDLPRFIRITDIDEKGLLRDDTFRSLPWDIALPYLLKPGDILLARSGATVGKTFRYDASWGTAAFAGYLIRARLDLQQCNSEFVAYFTQSTVYWDWLKSTFIQATIQNVSGEKYANLLIPVPPLAEQEAIVSDLCVRTTEMNELVTNIEKGIERLQEYRTALISAAVTGQIDVRGA